MLEEVTAVEQFVLDLERVQFRRGLARLQNLALVIESARLSIVHHQALQGRIAPLIRLSSVSQLELSGRVSSVEDTALFHGVRGVGENRGS